MRVVVLGGSGNVGTSLVPLLAADPAVDEVLAVARRRPEWSPAGTSWAECDLASGDLTGLLAGADVVVHLAWFIQPTHRPSLTWSVNAVGTARLLEAVAAAGVPALVVASSVGAYSPAPKDRLVDESWPTHGWSPAAYCREKAYVERLLDAFEADHPVTRVVRMRPSFLLKAEAAPQQRRLFAGPLVPERLAGRMRLPVVPDLPGLRFQVMHTEDAAEAYRLAVTGDARGAFNLAAEPVVDASVLGEVFGGKRLRLPARPVREVLAAAWRARIVPASPDLFDFLLRMPLMDTGRARRELGWSPRYTAKEALDACRRGLAAGTGFPTPPLQPSDPLRLRPAG